MKYHVTGAHKETADDIEVLVDAGSEDIAAQAVADMGIMVEKIEPASAPLPNEAVRYEYHTLRCDFGDLQPHLNKYAQDWWRVYHVHHDPQGGKMVHVLLERIHRVDTDSQY